MKFLKLLSFSLVLIATKGLFAQTTHLKLSTEYPQAGQKISFVYDPTGTVVDKKKNVSAIMVYYINYPNIIGADIKLKPFGKLYKGEALLPANCKLFSFRISADGKADNNNGKGYFYPTYKNKQPVRGAYAAEAKLNLVKRGFFWYNIKPDTNHIIDLFKKEFALYPESEKTYQDDYYYILNEWPGYEKLAGEKIANLLKSDNEDDLLLAYHLLLDVGRKKEADSVVRTVLTRFPEGFWARVKIWRSYHIENEVVKKDSLFKILARQAPTNLEDSSATTDAKIELAALYLKNGDERHAKKYESQLNSQYDKFNLSYRFNTSASQLVAEGRDLPIAEKLINKALNMLVEERKSGFLFYYLSPTEMAKNYSTFTDKYNDTYALILWKTNKPQAALSLIKQSYQHDTTAYAEHYAEILAANGRYDEAMKIAANKARQGKYWVVLTEELRKAYAKQKGTETGFDRELARLQALAKYDPVAELKKTMIDIEAPKFSLKDMTGKTVSLADLKGKIIVLDFWATWCGPCIASFPSMQLAINKYKNDPNVMFLFLDSNETDENYPALVKNLISGSYPDFQVLFDDKAKDGRQVKVAAEYKITAIPTRFIIDKNGHIRFRETGLLTPAELLPKITNMVEMVRSTEI